MSHLRYTLLYSRMREQAPHPSTATAFEWNEGNQPKLEDRGISIRDVLAVHGKDPKYLRNKNEAAGDWLMIGRDDHGRVLKLSILWADTETRTLRVATGWVMTGKKRNRG